MTALGIDNYGRMTYRYGYEEIDYVDGTSDWVWNCPNHVLFLRIRELFDAELCELYTRLESSGCWSATSLINQFNEWQMQFPEELWRVDIMRKYIRTYTGSYINGEARPEFLKERANGRKKTQRSQFEKNQEKYMASKFGGTTASADDIILRCSVPNTELAVQPNFDMHLTPYSHIYLNVKYNTSPPLRVRAEPNVEYTIEYDDELADIIEIYSASCLKSIGDLSACYLTNGDFANASKLRELKLGSDTQGYNNTNVMTLGLGANTLLNKLDIQNMSGLTHALDMTALKNLEELYAHGTNIGGITFADGGLIEIAELPAINSMTMKNLMYLTNLDITSFDKLTTLTVENCNTVDLLNVLENAPNVNRIRIVGINWDFTTNQDWNPDDNLLERLYNMSGIDRNGYNQDQSVLTGTVRIPTIGQYNLYKYQEAWPDLTIIPTTTIKQFVVTFVNDDENKTVLDVQYIDQFENAIDPREKEDNPISTPTKESSEQYDYTFTGWDMALTNIVADRVITAQYEPSLRKYTIQYVSKGVPVYTETADYGSNIIYEGDTPVYTAEEPYAFYLFNRWDKSGFLDNGFDENGIKTVTAIFDSFTYTDTSFDGKELEDMRPVEIYAMTKLNELNKVNITEIITDQDPYTFTVGNDVDYDDIESQLLISEKTNFNGTNYIDTGIQLFDVDKDFVLAIDYEFLDGNANNNVLVQCYNTDGKTGFQLKHNSNNVELSWASKSSSISAINKREILVIRHIKGSNNLIFYKSNLDSDVVGYDMLEGAKSTIGAGTLIFGASNPEEGYYENKAIGNINWVKIWYKDLGDAVCRDLAIWTHESITLQACGFRRYYLADNPSKRCSFSLLASHLLSRKKQWGSVGMSNIGGWAEASLNKSLNSRLYNAMPIQIKSLLKKVTIWSSIGGMSQDISSSDCYITIPSVYEVDPAQNTPPYNSEGSPISYMNSNQSRRRTFDGGDYCSYWLRSPSIQHTSYVFRVDEEDKNESRKGLTQAVTNPTNTNLGVLILISF